MEEAQSRILGRPHGEGNLNEQLGGKSYEAGGAAPSMTPKKPQVLHKLKDEQPEKQHNEAGSGTIAHTEIALHRIEDEEHTTKKNVVLILSL